MTTGLRWGRRISIRIPHIGVTIDGPPFHMQVQVRRELSRTPPSGVVSISGLSDATRNRIAGAKGRAIEIFAGYESQGDPAPVFAGTVANVYPRATLPGYTTEIEITSVGAGDEVRYAISVRSYGTRVAVRRVVEDIVRDMPGLESSLEDLPADVMLPKFVWAGDALSGLGAALRGVRVDGDVVGRVKGTWYEDDGVIRFDVPGEKAKRAIAWPVSPATGMIQAPFLTDRGVDVAMFLTPGIRLGDELVLDSRVTTGHFKVLSIRSTLSSYPTRAFAQQMTSERL